MAKSLLCAVGVRQFTFPTGRVAAGVLCHFQTSRNGNAGMHGVLFSHQRGKTGLWRFFAKNGQRAAFKAFSTFFHWISLEYSM
jgi:hypothetical protein